MCYSLAERCLHIHLIYLSVVCLQVKHLEMHFKPLNFTPVSVCLSQAQIQRILPHQLLKLGSEIHIINIQEQTPIHHSVHKSWDMRYNEERTVQSKTKDPISCRVLPRVSYETLAII